MDGVWVDVGTGRPFAEEVKAADCIMEERKVRESSTAETGSAGGGMDFGSDEDSGAAVLSFDAALSKASIEGVTVTVESLEVE